jgi:hypothetical protein
MTRIIHNDNPDPYVAGDLTVFEDIEEARRQLEIYDADPPEIWVCDEEGRQCRMLVDMLQVMDDTFFPRFDMARIERMLEGFILRACGETPAATLDEKLNQILRYQKR